MAKVKLDHLSLFTVLLSSMVRSRLPLDQVLDSLSQETPHPVLRMAVEDVTDDVRHGMAFNQALALHPRIFGELYVNLVEAGLVSGRLDMALEQLASYLSRKQQVLRKIRSALSYPLIMIVAFIGVFNGMVFLILPRFESLFGSMGRKLPALTQGMMNLGHLWRDSWQGLLFLAGLALGGWLLFYFLFNGRYYWDRLKIRLPLVGPLWRLAALSTFLKTFSVQLQNEVPVLQSLELAGTITGNSYMEESVFLVIDDVGRGESLAEALGRHAIFPTIVRQMVAAGEMGGNLADLVMAAADYYENLLTIQIDTMTSLINPVLTIGMAFAIGSMMVATFLPVFDISSTMTGG